MRALALLVLASCATIPGTDVAVPPESHEGWSLAACVPIEHRTDACCYYVLRDQVRTICTRDSGDTWAVMEEPGPIVIPEEPDEEQSL